MPLLCQGLVVFGAGGADGETGPLCLWFELAERDIPRQYSLDDLDVDLRYAGGQ